MDYAGRLESGGEVGLSLVVARCVVPLLTMGSSGAGTSFPGR